MIPQLPLPCLYLVLHDIRSSHNVGSIFRTADAAGVTKIYLCGTTPAPIDRFGRAQKDIAKVALGAEKSVQWEYAKDAKSLIADLRKQEFRILALELDPSAIDYRKAHVGEKSALLVGNEVEGIPKEMLEVCDEILQIPMKGTKESLNVAVATGVALFSLLP